MSAENAELLTPEEMAEAAAIDERLPKRWRHANVRRTDVYCHYSDALEGPNGERVLLRLNEHFPHEQDARDIAEMRNVFGRALAAVRAREAEAERLSAKINGLGGELAAELERSAALRAELAIVKTDLDGVWLWQGDGYDHLPSLSCPVVMSAPTLRSLLRATVIPASVAEAMTKIEPADDPFWCIAEAEQRASWAGNDEGIEGATDAGVVEKIDEALAYLLHARALLTADKPAGGAP